MSMICTRDQLEKMNEEQLIRFDFYMRSHFKKNQIKALIYSSLQPKFQEQFQSGASDPASSFNRIPDEIAIVVASLAKLYVGELVETGRIFQTLPLKHF
jgi:hypothetical protein